MTCYRKDTSCPKYSKVLVTKVKNVAILQTFANNPVTKEILELNFQKPLHKQKIYINSEHSIFIVEDSHLNYL